MDLNKDKILSIMKEYFPQEGWEDSQYWEEARTKYPHYKLPEWAAVNPQEDTTYNYVSEPLDVEISLDSINNLSNTLDSIFTNQDTLIAKNPPKSVKEWTDGNIPQFLTLNEQKNLTDEQRAEWNAKYPQQPETSTMYGELSGIGGDMPPINIFGGNIGMSKEDWHLKNFNEGNKNWLPNFMVPFVNEDGWLSDYIPDHRKETIKNALNNTIPALQYREVTGEDVYDVDYDKIHDDWADMFIGLGVGFTDPTTAITFLSGYGAAMGVATRGVRAATPAVRAGTNMIRKWAMSNYPRWFIQSTVSSPSLKKKVLDFSLRTAGNMLDGGIGTAAGFATIGSFSSRADQASNRGKYTNNNNTVNIWDTLNDSFEHAKDGFVVGALTGGVGSTLGRYQMWTNAKWKMGARNANVLTGKIVSSPLVKYGLGGLTTQSSMMLTDKDYRNQFYDYPKDKKAEIDRLAFNGEINEAEYNERLAAMAEFNWGKFASASASFSYILPTIFGIKSLVRRPIKTPFGKPIVVSKKTPTDPFVTKTTSKTEVKPVTTTVEPISKFNANDNTVGIVPKNKSFPHVVKNIQRDIFEDIKYETIKNVDLENAANKENNLINNSIKNVSRDIGTDVPFEFFEKDITTQTESIETINGLKEISNIVNQTFAILNKAGKKNSDGDYVDVDITKLTEDDIAHLTVITPSALDAYQGYRLKYYNETVDLNNLTDGQLEYLNRFKEKEFGGKELTDLQKKTILKALDLKISSYDVLKNNLNNSVIEGLSKSEQIDKKKLSPLDEERVEVVNADNEVINIDKSEADKYISENKVSLVKDAQNQGITPTQIVSDNQGLISPDLIKTALQDAVKDVVIEAQELGKPYGRYTRITKEEVKKLTKNIKGDELVKRAKRPSFVDGITDKFDIAALNEVLTDASINKHMSHVNKLFKHSGKKNLLSITKKDVENYLNDRIEQKRKKGQIPAIETGETSALRIVFNALLEGGFIKSTPTPSLLLKGYTTSLTAEKQAAVFAKEGGLPELEIWFKKSGKIYDFMKNADNATKLGILLIDRYPIRAEEVNALRGVHIGRKGNVFYLDLTRGTKTKDIRGIPGAAKGRGLKRIIWIPKELGLRLQKLGARNPKKRLFPNIAGKVTQALKKIPEFKDVKSKDYKRQMITFVEREAVGLTAEERSAFNLMAGHAMDVNKLTEADKSIIALYKNKRNWDELFQLQKITLEKIAMAREAIVTETPTKFEEMLIEGIKAPGLTIKDVSGKSSKESIKIIEKEVKNKNKLSNDIKNKLISSVKGVFNEVTEGMSSPEKIELLEFYAREAGIEDYAGFKINKQTNELELLDFADQIVNEKIIKAKDRKDAAVRYKHSTLAKDILIDADYNDLAQKNLIRKMFDEYSNLPLEQVSILNLSNNQVASLLEYLNTSPEFRTPNKFTYVENALNVQNTIQLAKKVHWGKRFLLTSGLMGRIEYTFPWLDKKLNTNGQLTKIGHDLINHAVIETVVGGWLKGFEVASYKLLHEDAVKSKLFITPALRKQKKVYINGKKIFDKRIKNNLWTLESKRYHNLVEHVKNHPEDKIAVRRLKNAKTFYDGIYDKDGNLRIDTVESQIARLHYKGIFGIMESIKIALKSNMNEAQYEKFIKKNPIKEIVKHFYVPRTATDKFLFHYDPNSLSLDKQIKDGTRYHAQKLAEEKYGTAKLSPKQIDEFMAKGEIAALKDIMVISTHGTNTFNPKHMLRRKMYMGERMFIPSENKWIDVYQTEYDAYMPKYYGASAKLIANLNAFPYLVNMPGLKVNRSIPKLLVDLSRQKNNLIPRYIHDIIASRTGLMTPNDGGVLSAIGSIIGKGNKYISRVNLTGLRSPIKNFRLALGQNALRYEVPSMIYNASLSLRFKDRIEASKTGYMGLSLSALTEADNSLLNKSFQRMFELARFPSSEQMGRLSSIYLALQELPTLVSNIRLNKGKKYEETLTKLKGFYRLNEEPIIITDKSNRKIIINGGQIELLKRFGLGTSEVDWSGKESTGIKGVDVKRFNDAGEVIKFDDEVFKLTPFERDKLQNQIELVHNKIITMSHFETQGSTLEIFQPHILMEKTGIIKGTALYAQLAIQGTYNQFNAVKDAVKHNNYRRIVAGLATAYGLSTLVEWGINDILLNKPNPKMLDRNLRNRLFRGLQRADIGASLSFTWGLLNQELPIGNPLFPNAFLNQATELTGALLDIARLGAEELGVDARDWGGLSKYAVSDRNFKQISKDLTGSIVAQYRDFKALYVNNNHPYAVRHKEIQNMEMKFYKETKAPKPEIISNSVMTRHYREIKDAFNKTGGNFKGFWDMDKDDWEYLNGVIMNAWWSRRNEYIQNGYKADEASIAATDNIDMQLMMLHPILNGQGNTKTDKKHLRTRKQFELYLKKLAKDQGRDENFHLDKALEQEKKYYLKMRSFLTQWGKWVSNHENYKMDENKKYWKQIVPGSWEKYLGVKVKPGISVPWKGIDLDTDKILKNVTFNP